MLEATTRSPRMASCLHPSVGCDALDREQAHDLPRHRCGRGPLWRTLPILLLVLLLEVTALCAHAAGVAGEPGGAGVGLRGFNLGAETQPPLSDKDYADLAAYGANVVRIGVEAPLAASGNAFELTASGWAVAERTVAMGSKHGFKVILTLVSVPWGEDAVFWDRPELQASLVHIWSKLAARFKGNKVIAGYDLINEPVRPRDRNRPQSADGASGKPDQQADDWRNLAVAMTRAIRAEDPESTIIYEPSPWGLPKGFGKLTPLPFSGVVYSFHFYEPHALTHQGLYNHQAAISYPSEASSRAQLSRSLDPVRAFALKYTVPILVGEFSIVRWAPGGSAARYLSDVIELFEAEGWSWVYHSFREYEGWDAEIDPTLPRGNPARRSSNAAAIRLLMEKGFFKNTRAVVQR